VGFAPELHREYDMRCYFNVHSKLKAEISRFNFHTEPKRKKMDVLRSIGKQCRESMKSVLKKKREATMGRICRKGRF